MPLRHLVVARSRLPALGAPTPDAFMSLQGDRKPGLADAASMEPDPLVNKAHEMLNPVQDRFNLELDSWSFGLIVQSLSQTIG